MREKSESDLSHVKDVAPFLMLISCSLSHPHCFVFVCFCVGVQQAMQLSMNAGEVIEVVATDESGWWYG